MLAEIPGWTPVLEKRIQDLSVHVNLVNGNQGLFRCGSSGSNAFVFLAQMILFGSFVVTSILINAPTSLVPYLGWLVLPGTCRCPDRRRNAKHLLFVRMASSVTADTGGYRLSLLLS